MLDEERDGSEELALEQSLEWKASLDAVCRALKCVVLRWATKGSGRNGMMYRMRKNTEVLWQHVGGLELFYSRSLYVRCTLPGQVPG